MELSKEQQKIHDNVVDWVNSYDQEEKQYITVGGYAGTGKTTLLSILSKTLEDQNIKKAFCTFTGRASLVLKSKLKDQKNIFSGDYCGTIHSLIYKPLINNKGEITGWTKKDFDDFEHDVIIVDEASMVSKELWNDLLYYERPIIALGDHGQLPPVSKDIFNLMQKPEMVLTEIHRQALDNPIIKLSMMARNGEYIKCGNFGDGVFKIHWNDDITKKIFKNLKIDNELIMLCGTNKSRVKLNKYARGILGIDDQPFVNDERIICLKNNKNIDIMNGQICTLKKFTNSQHGELMNFNVVGDGFEKQVKSVALRSAFNNPNPAENNKKIWESDIRDFMKNKHPYQKVDEFDYGYAITCHKSQGGEWSRVILFDQRNYYQTDEMYARWLYTGITRAKEKLLIVEGF